MSSERLKQTLLQWKQKWCIFNARSSSIDSTALDILEEFCLAAEGRGQQVQFAALQPEVEKMIRTIRNQEKNTISQSQNFYKRCMLQNNNSF